MTEVRLTDKHWTKIREFIVQDPKAYLGKDEMPCRHFVEAVKWVSRSGRSLPPEYSKSNTIYKRFVRWCENGVWERLLNIT